MQELQIFQNDEFGSIRVVIIKDETWLVGKDIATALGYARPENVVTDRIDEDDRIFVDKKLVLELGISFDYKELGQRGGWIINESGMYTLIFDSKLKTAKKFKHWVTSEVLPSIRKTGSYGQQKSTQEQILLLAQGTTELYQRIDELDAKIENSLSDLPLLGVEEAKISNAVKRKGVEVLGGKKSNAYKDRSIVNAVYRDIYGQIYREFDINTYKAIKRNQCDIALKIIAEYKLPLALKKRIENANAQQTLDLEGGVQ